MTANGLCTLRVRALPLPSQLTSVLDNHTDLLQRLIEAPATAATADMQDTRSCGSTVLGPSPHQETPQGGALAEGVSGLSLEGDALRNASDASWTLLDHPTGSAANQNQEQLPAASHASALAEEQTQRSAHAGASKQENAVSAREAVASTAPVEEGHGNGEGSLAVEGAAGDVEAFRGRLRAAVDEAGGSGSALLQRAWLLGPRQVCSRAKLMMLLL